LCAREAEVNFNAEGPAPELAEMRQLRSKAMAQVNSSIEDHRIFGPISRAAPSLDGRCFCASLNCSGSREAVRERDRKPRVIYPGEEPVC